ncbi:zinc ribbon domain-containing protein [Alkalicoccus urumqiensis]|uniref:zinc ribbon domain-containing protein n=1 Tax=Alkalicoccus urumqiensis TaxID=1548213 RepID=UPI001158609C|nr:zinc ribbon domain-containing protein [Alkalicoccus urumqiensis]
MALTPCPECRESVSTRAKTCPHCGYPLQPDRPIIEERPRKEEPDHTVTFWGVVGAVILGILIMSFL